MACFLYATMTPRVSFEIKTSAAAARSKKKTYEKKKKAKLRPRQVHLMKFTPFLSKVTELKQTIHWYQSRHPPSLARFIELVFLLLVFADKHIPPSDHELGIINFR